LSDPVEESFLKIDQDLADRTERRLEHGRRVAADLDKTLISLSAGALVFSMTFANSLAPAKHVLWILFSAWIAFAATMLSVIFAQRRVQAAIVKTIVNLQRASEAIEKNKALHSFLKTPVKPLKSTVTPVPSVDFLNNLAMGAFLLGISLLGIFVGLNLWFGSLPPPGAVR
jgi:hypothetical protein